MLGFAVCHGKRRRYRHDRREISARAEQEALAQQRQEAESFTIGPGVTGTKSQMCGGIGGLVVGAVLGAVIGVIVGAAIGGSALTIILAVVGAVAGGTAGGVLRGFLRPRQKLEGGEADT